MCLQAVIAKHVQNIGIIKTFCLPGGRPKFFSAWETEKIAGLWFACGGSVPRLTYYGNSMEDFFEEKFTEAGLRKSHFTKQMRGHDIWSYCDQS